jgi:transcriptional regulator with XRE-family HTH domain
MRISKLKTTVAVLRNALGMKTPDFADLVGLSLSAVEKLETGRLKLSEQVAGRISFETGVSEKWLLARKSDAWPVTDSGRPFSQDTYSATRTNIEKWGQAHPDVENSFMDWFVLQQAVGLKCVATSANANGKLPLFLSAVTGFLSELEQKFGLVNFECAHLIGFCSERLKDFHEMAVEHGGEVTESRLRLVRASQDALRASIARIEQEENKPLPKTAKPTPAKPHRKPAKKGK